MRSACRRVNSDLATEEIMALYKLIREEAMSRRYHGQQIKDALFQPEQQPEKQFRVDRSLFLSLFKDLVPFGGGGSVGEMLAGRIWRLLAKDDQENCFKIITGGVYNTVLLTAMTYEQYLPQK